MELIVAQQFYFAHRKNANSKEEELTFYQNNFMILIVLNLKIVFHIYEILTRLKLILPSNLNRLKQDAPVSYR